MASPKPNYEINGTEASITTTSSSNSPTNLSNNRGTSAYHFLSASQLHNLPRVLYKEDKPSCTASSPWTLGSTNGSHVAVVNAEQSRSIPPSITDDATNSIPGLINTGAVIASNGKAITLPQQSLYHERLVLQASASVEAVLAASCEVMGFDIAEVWLRTGHKTHQLTNSHLRPTALEDSVRKDIVNVYYGEKSNERTHRLSPALCKRAKEAGDVIWVTANSSSGADILSCSISDVRTAVALPVCHETSNTNLTVIFFSMRRYVLVVA